MADSQPVPLSYRVLLVDDVEVQRALVKAYLKGTAFEVVGEAADGAQAIQATKSLKPDLVLLDLNMPIMSGLDALPAIMQAHPEASVIVFSDFDRNEMEPLVYKRGAVAYLEKNLASPLLPDALMGVVNAVKRSAAGSRKPTILVVDDDPENLDALASYFEERLQCNVVAVSNAKDGLDVLRNKAVDLILSDHNMPEMSGLEFLLIAKKLFPKVPRVMLTAYGDSSLQARATSEAEVRDFLNRGASLDQIESSLRRILKPR